MKKMPSMLQAADYSATIHYLNAVEAAKTDEGDAVVKQMKATKVNDFFAKGGTIRADGRAPYQAVARVMARLSASGFTKLNLITDTAPEA